MKPPKSNSTEQRRPRKPIFSPPANGQPVRIVNQHPVAPSPMGGGLVFTGTARRLV